MRNEMGRFSTVYVVLLAVLAVEGNSVLDAIRRVASEVQRDVQEEMRAASDRVRQSALDVMPNVTQSIKVGETWLELELEGPLDKLAEPCKPLAVSVKKDARKSLWSCLQMARVVTDGTDIASQGFEVASDILGTANNFLQSLTACILGPADSISQEVACYLSAMGTIATGVAENIEQVEHYVNVVKRDVGDINAAIALCNNQTYALYLTKIQHQQEKCSLN